MNLALDQLREAHACEPQVALFATLFGDSVEVTVARATEHAEDFDFRWAINFLLKGEQREKGKRELPACDLLPEVTAAHQKAADAKNPLWIAYLDARNKASQECDLALANSAVEKAFAHCRKAVQPFDEELETTLAELDASRSRAIATLFATLYLESQP